MLRTALVRAMLRHRAATQEAVWSASAPTARAAAMMIAMVLPKPTRAATTAEVTIDRRMNRFRSGGGGGGSGQAMPEEVFRRVFGHGPRTRLFPSDSRMTKSVPMSRNTDNDVPPDILDTEDDDEAVAVEGGSDVEFDLEANPGSVQRGTEVIRRFWTTLPNAPGVYRMFDGKGDVLYVGKAKSLKARVGSYARGQAHSNRIARMIAETTSMEFVTTATETEALLLEANLIKQLRPRYNVLLRDDKSLPYILLTADHEAPQIVKHRGARKRKGDYYGPFASVWAVNRTINALQRAFLLRSCNDSYYENRTRPCLLFQIKRCSGPCTGEIPLDDYAGLAGEARAFLAGKSNAVKERITAEMQAGLRGPRIRARRPLPRPARGALGHPGRAGHQHPGGRGGGRLRPRRAGGPVLRRGVLLPQLAELGQPRLFPARPTSRMTPRRGARLVRRPVLRRQAAAAPRAALARDRGCRAAWPRALSTRADRRVEIHAPKRGERRQLIDYVLRNAKEALGRRLADTASQAKLLISLGQAFGLAKAPRRVEVYDNSHIMGTNAVGAMMVAGAGGFMKTHYRTFNMRSEDLTPGDDYGMMREMLQRRFARLVKEAPRIRRRGRRAVSRRSDGAPALLGRRRRPRTTDTFPAWPDLVLIDGGKGQLEAARQALAEVGVGEGDVALVGIAKGRDRDAGRETFFMAGPARRSSCRRAIRRSISCSACATRRIASPSAPTGPSASAR